MSTTSDPVYQEFIQRVVATMREFNSATSGAYTLNVELIEEKDGLLYIPMTNVSKIESYTTLLGFFQRNGFDGADIREVTSTMYETSKMFIVRSPYESSYNEDDYVSSRRRGFCCEVWLVIVILAAVYYAIAKHVLNYDPLDSASYTSQSWLRSLIEHWYHFFKNNDPRYSPSTVSHEASSSYTHQDSTADLNDIYGSVE